MNYISGDNVYGNRPINKMGSKGYIFDKNETQVEQEIVKPKEHSCNEGKYDKKDYKCCDDKKNDNCDNHYNEDDKWDCEKTDKCCKGDVYDIDLSKTKCVCSYMDIIFSEKTVTGAPIFFNLDTGNGEEYNIKAEYKPLDHNCCTKCTIDTTSKFEIDDINVTIKPFNLVSPKNGDVFIDGELVSYQVSPQGNLEASISSMILDKDCSDLCKGTKVSILLNNLESWNFIGKIDLCGTVTTNSVTCKFKVTFETKSLGITTSLPSTFVAPQICIPNINEDGNINLIARFSAIAQLISPSLSAVLLDPTDDQSPVVLTLTGNTMISPMANLEIIQNTKVCFNAMI